MEGHGCGISGKVEQTHINPHLIRITENNQALFNTHLSVWQQKEKYGTHIHSQTQIQHNQSNGVH